MHDVRRSLYSRLGVSLTKSKRRMHNAAPDFLKIKEIPDKVEIDSVDLVRKEPSGSTISLDISSWISIISTTV